MPLIVIYYCFFLLFQTVSGDLLSGDQCDLGGGKFGICRQLSQCPSAIVDLKNGKMPKTCGFEGKVPIVCCAAREEVQLTTHENEPEATDFRDIGKVSAEKCKTYANLVYVNHSSPTLLPGVLFEIEDTCAVKEENYREISILAREFPHLASIGYGSKQQQLWKCLGALISDRHVLTAATCHNMPRLGQAKYVRVGSTSIRENFYHEKPLQYIDIDEFMKHPLFDDSTLVNNIAIVKLREPVKFTTMVRPACLNMKTEIPEEAINVGWGTLDSDSYLNNEPRKNILQIKRNDRTCTQLDSKQFCAQPESNFAPCYVDQGSPLQVVSKENYCTYDILGILSDGKNCLRYRPGVYTNVTSYIAWIEKTVWK